MDELPSSPTPEGSLAYYKSQYEQLENDLAEFQSSSQQLEAELEKDVEAAENRERILKEKVESLGFEVDEWKAKYKQSKLEASSAQSALQKEITTLREATRTLQLKLRDIEVENDDFERQARNTTSSLEDLESKYNMAIERGVIIEEEIKIGEQERENLRIENQRLRDELSDIKIEAEILHDKLRKRQISPIIADAASLCGESFSPSSNISSPITNTPQETKSVAAAMPVSDTPPSPPISETSGPLKSTVKTPTSVPKSRLKMPTGTFSITPKPTVKHTSSGLRNSRGPVAQGKNFRMRNATPSVIRQTRTKAPATRGLPNSNSLTHIRSLTAQMQRLELRVQSARSKLPAPVTTPPRSSIRNESLNLAMPSSITIRNKKKLGEREYISSTDSDDKNRRISKQSSMQSTTGVSRLSFGSSQTNAIEKRSSSRASGSYSSLDRPLSRTEIARPTSRASTSGIRSSLGPYSSSQFTKSHRLRLSFGSSQSSVSHGHGQSQSVSRINLEDNLKLDNDTPTRREKSRRIEDMSSIPVYNGAARRKSGPSTSLSRRTSFENTFDSSMRPPSRPRKLSDLGETY
ncbi:Nuclear distribution protein nudE-like protein 1 [Golovinomyces cichoracearum]|uniref:Nuclear distribution protein nudE-like protein 1 n=1 Tax=Golovinomyces cichoracearum TaxID=62708 RepID=A0A420J6S9_9PEZI|nr:Nuclear distribution protein nudE-like protein 1 [Golovinomyces cichoracearum]